VRITTSRVARRPIITRGRGNESRRKITEELAALAKTCATRVAANGHRARRAAGGGAGAQGGFDRREAKPMVIHQSRAVESVTSNRRRESGRKACRLIPEVYGDATVRPRTVRGSTSRAKHAARGGRQLGDCLPHEDRDTCKASFPRSMRLLKRRADEWPKSGAGRQERKTISGIIGSFADDRAIEHEHPAR